MHRGTLVDLSEAGPLMTTRNPALWGLCALIVIVFAYCFYVGAISQ